MSPLEVVNPELYRNSKQVNDWHRHTFPDHYSAFDIDLAGVCGLCKRVLYFCEGTTNPTKVTSYLNRLSYDHHDDVPVFLFLHEKDDEPVFVQVSQVFPTRHTFDGIADCERRIHELRAAHAEVCERG